MSNPVNYQVTHHPRIENSITVEFYRFVDALAELMKFQGGHIYATSTLEGRGHYAYRRWHEQRPHWTTVTSTLDSDWWEQPLNP